MNQGSFLSKTLFIMTTLCALNLSAQSTPSEKTSLQIRRTATSPSVVSDFLTKNYYTSSTHCSRYETIQVPYQDTEYYTESVPYTEWVTDYRQERRCEPEIRHICHIEQDCSSSGGGEVCSMVRECDPQNPDRCKERQVCRPTPSTPICRDRQVCVDTVVPGEGNCHYVSVPYQREVTRYRDETRTRYVTKYRSEQRCVDTGSANEYDHQASYDVDVVFPANARLTGSQKEVLNIILVSSDEYNPRVALESVNTIYSYRIRNQSVNSNQIRVELEVIGGGGSNPPNPPNPPSGVLTPLTSANLAGLKSAANINASLIGNDANSALVVTDLTKEYSDISTSYVIYVDLIVNGKAKPLNSKTFTRGQLKVANMTVKLSAITSKASSLKAGNVIEVTLVAKRSGTSSLLAGKTLKPEKTIKFVIK